jgi:hypothetical protein
MGVEAAAAAAAAGMMVIDARRLPLTPPDDRAAR